MTTTREIPTNGPFALGELATLGFGYQEQASFDGVMRMGFCVDGDYETQAAVEVRQHGETLEITIQGDADPDAVAAQTARILSCDHDGNAFAELGHRDKVIGRLFGVAPGLRPPLFCSPYEAAVWSIVSARRPKNQGIRMRRQLCESAGRIFTFDGVPVEAVPTPSQLAAVQEVPGLPADRLPRLHAIAAAAAGGLLSIDHLTAMTPDEAMTGLQQLPGIGPFYSSLVVIRACGLADVLPLREKIGRAEVERLYELPAPLSDDEYIEFGKRLAPFRTWALVLIRAAGNRLVPAA